MSRSSLRRLATVAAATAALTAVAVPSPALAGDLYFSKSTSTIVSTSWVEHGPLPGVSGDVHVGFMDVEDLGRGRADVFGIVEDYSCEAGEIPVPPEGHGAPVGEDACDFHGFRVVSADQVTLSIDKKFTRATLTGTLSVQGHDGPVARPGVTMSWTGVGGTFSTRVSDTYTDEIGTFRLRYDFRGRNAVVDAGSKIGVMVFDDDPRETSSALMGTQRNSERSSS